jgi:hypothetical protein
MPTQCCANAFLTPAGAAAGNPHDDFRCVIEMQKSIAPQE